MAISLNYFLCVLSSCVSVALLYPANCNAQYMFVLGDSLYDPGNLQYVVPDNLPPSYNRPYGSSYFPNATGRFSDGRTVADFICQKLGIPFLPAGLNPNGTFPNGANFASGGSGVFDNHTDTINLNGQYEYLVEVADSWKEELGEAVAARMLQEAVYLICMGGNDYFSFATENPSATFEYYEQYVDYVVGNLSVVIRNMSNEVGARKFMFQMVVPLGCMPMWKQSSNITGDGCAEAPLVLAALHNAALVREVESLAKEIDGFIYSVFDIFSVLSERISNPTKYGFQVGDKACCGVGSHNADSCGNNKTNYYECTNKTAHVYFDGGHNTDAANGQFAELMWEGGTDLVFPYNMSTLFHLVSHS